MAGKFTDNLDSLVTFLKTDPSVEKIMTGTDSITGKPTNPFSNLSNGELNWDSLYHSPKTLTRYLLQVDTSIVADTVINARGRILKIDTTRTIGQRYFIKGPDGFGTIGDVDNEALKNTASWE